MGVGKTKVVDEDEAKRLLFDEGRSLRWMVAFYREKYGVETSLSLWSRFMTRNSESNVPQRVTMRPEAVPWRAREHARRSHFAGALRALDRIERKDPTIPRSLALKAMRVKKLMVADDLVVSYDPEANEFVLVPRRPGVDEWWIRDPFLDDDGNETFENYRWLRTEAIAAHEGVI